MNAREKSNIQCIATATELSALAGKFRCSLKGFFRKVKKSEKLFPPPRFLCSCYWFLWGNTLRELQVQSQELGHQAPTLALVGSFRAFSENRGRG